MRSSGHTITPGTKVNWRVIKTLLPYLKEYRFRIFFAFICLVLAKLSTIALPFILKYIVDGLSETKTATQATSQFDVMALALTPLILVIAYGAFRFSNVLFGELRDTLFSRVTERAIRRISLAVFKHLHKLDVSFHLDRKTGGLARDIERGTHGINFLMRFMIFNIIPTLLEISLVIGILLTAYGPIFGLLTGLSVLTYGFFTVYVTDWRSQYIRAANEADSVSNTRAIDSLLNYETVKYFTNENFEASRYDKDLAKWETAKLTNRFSLFALNAGQALIISSAIAALMYVTVDRVSNGLMTVGDLVLVNAFLMQLFMPLNFLGFVYREIRTALINIENMFGLLDKKPKVDDNSKDNLIVTSPPSIKFIEVGFSYQENREILKDVNFEIEPNQTVAIVGGSGAGKSTIAKLVLRFYDPTQGKIEINGQDISQVTQNSLRGAIGIVPQDTVLFNDTLFENIKYGNPNAKPLDVERVIKLAHLDQFIQALPDGVETIVGERGLKLSGGEKQRVAIARALLKEPPIMIFDEATSSLDSRSENAILDAIKDIASEHTSIVVAHRLSTIIHADKILVLDAGQVVEVGNHQALLARKGAYYALWSAQQKKQTDKQLKQND